MKSHLPLAFLLPLLVPMGLGAIMVHFGTGPKMPDIVADLKSPDQETRANALDWLAEIRRPSTLPDLVPVLEDPEPRVRRRAIKAIGKLRNPEAAPLLVNAARTDRENAKDAVQALQFISYSQVLPYFEQLMDEGNPANTPELRALAEKNRIDLLKSLNKEASFYSLGDRIWNRLGHAVYSQAVLFAPGRAIARETPATTLEVPVVD